MTRPEHPQAFTRWDPKAGRRVRIGCRRCEDTGLVALDRLLPDGRAVLDVYRCTCPAGDRVYKGFLPEPLPGQPSPYESR